MSHLKLHFALHTSHCTLHTPHCTLHTPHFTLHTSHFSLPFFTLQTSHFTLRTSHCTLYAPHFTLHTSSHLSSSHLIPAHPICHLSFHKSLPSTTTKEITCAVRQPGPCVRALCEAVAVLLSKRTWPAKITNTSLSQPGCSHSNTIYDLQLQKTIVLHMQRRQRATLTQPLQCDLQRLSCKTQ